MKNKWYEITDIDQFIDTTRVLVFDYFGKEKSSKKFKFYLDELSSQEIQEINSVLTHQECKLIAKDYIKTKNSIHKINDTKYMEMIEAFNSRLVSNLLRSLTANGFLESAYDSSCNDFVFWVKDKDNDK